MVLDLLLCPRAGAGGIVNVEPSQEVFFPSQEFYFLGARESFLTGSPGEPSDFSWRQVWSWRFIWRWE